ncbi:hypothetical protein A2U01_0044894, partial [Trifolium medium]|nr:hypothetical protein [Trifolium medium]
MSGVGTPAYAFGGEGVKFEWRFTLLWVDWGGVVVLHGAG